MAYMYTELLSNSSIPIREDLLSALDLAWSEIAQTGSWLSGEQRIQLAREARQAWECQLCGRQKEALSPYAIAGKHDSVSTLPIGGSKSSTVL